MAGWAEVRALLPTNLQIFIDGEGVESIRDLAFFCATAEEAELWAAAVEDISASDAAALVAVWRLAGLLAKKSSQAAADAAKPRQPGKSGKALRNMLLRQAQACWQARQARQARQPEQAQQARQAPQAQQVWQARQARQVRQGLPGKGKQAHP